MIILVDQICTYCYFHFLSELIMNFSILFFVPQRLTLSLNVNWKNDICLKIKNT